MPARELTGIVLLLVATALLATTLLALRASEQRREDLLVQLAEAEHWRDAMTAERNTLAFQVSQLTLDVEQLRSLPLPTCPPLPATRPTPQFERSSQFVAGGR